MVKVSNRMVVLQMLPPWFSMVMDDDGNMWRRGQMGWIKANG